MTGPADAVAGATTVLTLQHHDRIKAAIDKVLAEGRPFDADEIHQHLPADTAAWLDAHPQVLGGYVQSIAQAGRIRHVGWTDSNRRPGRPQRVWDCPRRSTTP